MLPDFPGLKSRIMREIDRELRSWVRADPLLGLAKHTQVFEGDRCLIHRQSGEVDEMQFKSVSGEIKIDTEALIEMGPYAYHDERRRVAGQIQRAQGQQLVEEVNRITQRAGNIVHGNGEQFTFGLFIKGLEKVWIDFADDGKPILPTVVVDPTTAERVKSELPQWEMDPTKKKILDELIEKKRAEWRDRESNRKLVD